MKWRKEPPDKPGWWWLRAGTNGPAIPFRVAFSDDGIACLMLPADRGDMYPFRACHCSTIACAEWSGPIEEPQEEE